jgi:hypothetical protein
VYLVSEQWVQYGVVGIATRYELDGPGIESRLWRDLPHSCRPDLGPTQPPVQWVAGLFSRRLIVRGMALTNHPPPSDEVAGRVEV